MALLSFSAIAAVIVIAGNTPQIPFDTSSINTHTYDASLTPWTIESEVSSLTSYITEAATRADGKNTMWRVFGIKQRAKPAEIENPTDAKLDLLMTQVTQLAKQIEGIPSATYGTIYGTGPVFYGGSVPASVFSNYQVPYTFPIDTTYTTSPTTSPTTSSLTHPVPSKFDNFIERAKAIALIESASLTVQGHDATDDAVILTSGGWRLSDENVKKIDRLAGTLKIKFRLYMTPR